MDFFADKHVDISVIRRDMSNINDPTGALHHKFSVNPLLSGVDIAVEQHWHSSDAVSKQIQGSVAPLPCVRLTEFGRQGVYGGAHEQDPEIC